MSVAGYDSAERRAWHALLSDLATSGPQLMAAGWLCHMREIAAHTGTVWK